MSRYLSKVGHFNKLFVYMSPWLWKWDISINFLLICPITFKNYTQKHLFSYAISNVREYWIVDPRRRTITVNFFEQNILNIQYSFDATIKVNIYDDLYIDFS